MTGAVTGLTLTLVEEFARDLRRALTINQLARACRKAYPNVHAAVQRLLKEGVLEKQVVGHAHNCKLDLTNPKAILYLCLVQARKRGTGAHDTPDALLVWQREADLLLVTREPLPATPGKTYLTPDQLLADKDLFATLGRHTLLKGHGYYARLLEEHAREVLR